jgi:glycerol-3-phosphate O-acyltransferase
MSWLAVGAYTALVIAGYEIVRYIVVTRVQRRIRDGAIRFVRQHRVRLESARFIDRVWIRERLASDPAVELAILESARKTGDSVPALRERVDTYVEEIAPYFSLTMYYRFGAAMARRFVQFCYEMVVRPQGYDEQSAGIPEDVIRVYICNHRSNFDPVVLAFGLLRQIALSYAVGEWALVWPLSALFRMFGSYFVRRGETDPLYHAVLERFIQLLAGQGAVTGFFIEGALSRDGGLRRPRVGLLDYLIKVRKEFPEKDIVFLPVALNYDRVLEDRILVRERDGRPPRPRLVTRLFNLGAMMFWLPWLILVNAFDVARRSERKFGYAAIEFGKPLRLSDWPGGSTIHAMEDEPRQKAVIALAEELLFRRIGASIPVTPVSALCVALRRPGARDEGSVTQRIREVLVDFRAAGATIALGTGFDDVKSRRNTKANETSMPDIDRALLDSEEAELVFRSAWQQLARRLIIRKKNREIEIIESDVIDYYANAVSHHWLPDGWWRADPQAPRRTNGPGADVHGFSADTALPAK